MKNLLRFSVRLNGKFCPILGSPDTGLAPPSSTTLVR